MAEYLARAISFRSNIKFSTECPKFQKPKERFGHGKIDRSISLSPIPEEIENHNIPKQGNIFSLKKPQKSIREISTPLLTIKLETDELLNEISVLNNELSTLNNELTALNNELTALNNAYTTEDQNTEYKLIQEKKEYKFICDLINKFLSSKRKDKKTKLEKETQIKEIEKTKLEKETKTKEIEKIKLEKETQIKEIKTRLSTEIEMTSRNAYLNFSTQYF